MLLFLTACNHNLNRPRKLYIESFMNTNSTVEEIVGLARDRINQEVGTDFFNFSGDKPVTIRMVPPEDVGEDVFAHARYLEYHCLIQIRSDIEQMARESVNPSHPDWVADAAWKEAATKIVMHELGHCAGFVHSPDPLNLMYYSYNSSWNASSITEFVKRFVGANKE